MRTPSSGIARPRDGRLVAIGVVLGVLTAFSIAEAPRASAEDAEFPTWAEVSEARNNEAAQKALVDQINASVAARTAEAEAAQKDAEAKGAASQQADQAFQEQSSRTATLQKQADEANRIAAESERQAGLMMAQLYRTGGGDDLTFQLFTSANPEELLAGLGAAGQLTAQISYIKDRAIQDRNTAQAQSDAAEEARQLREKLKAEAEEAFAAAQEASIAAATALEEARAAKVEADAKLAVLAANREATEADYAAGEAIRIAEEEAARAAAAAALAASGWAKPVSGWISSTFGWRVHPISGGWTYHSGTDIAAGCWSTIYAAGAGVVNYAGPNGGYGNFVQIDHGGGIATAYGHIQWGGIIVGYGEWVEAGQPIAYVGTTGNSTGCHLHLEVREWGTAIDAAAFLADRGVYLG